MGRLLGLVLVLVRRALWVDLEDLRGVLVRLLLNQLVQQFQLLGLLQQRLVSHPKVRLESTEQLSHLHVVGVTLGNNWG